MKRIVIFSIIAFVGLSTGCQKFKYKEGQKRLPKETTKGRGMFACYIDDYTYIAKRQESITYNPETGYLFLENSNEGFEFRLFVYEGIYGEGVYQFENTNEEWITSDYLESYGLREGGTNELKITKLNTDNKIVSGTFNIDLEDSNGNQKLIRDGRFDLEIQVVE